MTDRADIPAFIDMHDLGAYSVDTLRYYQADLFATVQLNKRQRLQWLLTPIALVAVAWLLVALVAVAFPLVFGAPVSAGPAVTIAMIATIIALVVLMGVLSLTPGAEARVAHRHLFLVRAELTRRQASP